MPSGQRAVGAQRGDDRAGRRGAVERVQVHAGRAVGQQLGGLGGRVGDAELGHRARVVLARSSSRRSASGMRAPHSAAMPLDLADARDRDDPRQHRDVDAGGAQPVDEAAVVVVVEEQLGDEHAHAGVDLRAQVREVRAPSRASPGAAPGRRRRARRSRPRRPARSAPASSARRPRARVQVDSPRGGSPRSASTLSAPPARGLGQQLDEALAREAGGGDVRDGLQAALARQPADDGERQVARRAARAAGDRDERRLERRQLLDRAPERQLGLDRARRRELERDDRLAAASLLVDASSARHRREDRDLVAVGDRRSPARRGSGCPRP